MNYSFTKHIKKSIKIFLERKVYLMILGILVSAFPLHTFAAQVNPPQETYQIPILVYHSVEPATTKKEGAMQKHYHIYPENFEAQMLYLKDHGYSPIPFQQAIHYYRFGGKLPEKPVVITFDDGWKNQFTYAYPILKKFGYPATFFIITKSRGGVYMSWDDIRELDQAGMDIGSHTETHANLAKSDASMIMREVAQSRETLEREVGHPIESIAYPYYGNNTHAQELVREAGYRAARAGWTGKRNSLESLYQLASQEAVNNTNPFSGKSDHS